MTRVLILRHGITAWNAEGRIQGHTDIPLSPEGRAMVQAWAVPAEFQGFAWVVSPLGRARETAALLGAENPEADEALMEMRWGEWEGQRLAELRERFGAEMAANEARGLDFRPPGGESPRELRQRLQPWLAQVAREGRDRIAVAHKGVIRALYTLASGWDMTGKPPDKLQWACAHLFALDGEGTPRCERLNIPLARDGTGGG